MLRYFNRDETPEYRLDPPPIDALVPVHVESATFAVG